MTPSQPAAPRPSRGRRTTIATVLASAAAVAFTAFVPLAGAHADPASTNFSMTPAAGTAADAEAGTASGTITLPGCQSAHDLNGDPGHFAQVYLVHQVITTPVSVTTASDIWRNNSQPGYDVYGAYQLTNDTVTAQVLAGATQMYLDQHATSTIAGEGPGQWTFVAICAAFSFEDSTRGWATAAGVPDTTIAAVLPVTLSVDGSWVTTPVAGGGTTPSGTPTPTDSATPTPTDSGTPTPSPTPTDSGTPTPTPTPTDSGTPTPTPATPLADGGSVTPGTSYQVAFAAGTFGNADAIDVVLHSDPVSLGRVAAAADGSLNFTLPGSALSGLAAGSSHTLAFTDATDAAKSRTIAFTVAAATTPAGTGSNPVSSFLTDSARWAAATPQGAGVLIGGIVLLLAGALAAWALWWRRRRTAEQD